MVPLEGVGTYTFKKTNHGKNQNIISAADIDALANLLVIFSCNLTNISFIWYLIAFVHNTLY